MATSAGDVVMETSGSEPPGIGLASGCVWVETFQDAGGWLVEVVDEEPTWGRVSPGGQFCEKIGGIIVL